MPTVSGGLSVMTTGTPGTPPSYVAWWDSIREYCSHLLFGPSAAQSVSQSVSLFFFFFLLFFFLFLSFFLFFSRSVSFISQPVSFIGQSKLHLSVSQSVISQSASFIHPSINVIYLSFSLMYHSVCIVYRPFKISFIGQPFIRRCKC